SLPAQFRQRLLHELRQPAGIGRRCLPPCLYPRWGSLWRYPARTGPPGSRTGANGDGFYANALKNLRWDACRKPHHFETIVDSGVHAMKINRINWLAGALGTVAALFLTPATAAEKVRLAQNLSPISGVSIIAKEKGFFDRQGLDVQVSNFTSGKQCLQTVMGGGAEDRK